MERGDIKVETVVGVSLEDVIHITGESVRLALQVDELQTRGTALVTERQVRRAKLEAFVRAWYATADREERYELAESFVQESR